MTVVISKIESRFFDERPPGTQIDTLIIHSMFAPEPPDPALRFSATHCKNCLDRYEVSAHYMIERGGKIWQLVPEDKRAWHAGESSMPFDDDSRTGVNAFSIGIELLCSEEEPATELQYKALIELLSDILSRHRIENILGHLHIAPDRKNDPLGFNWDRFRLMLSEDSPDHVFRLPDSDPG